METEFRANATNVAKPPQRARWFHSSGTTWVTFSDADDTTLENWWAQNEPEMLARATNTREQASRNTQNQSSPYRGWIPESLSSQFGIYGNERKSVIPPPPPPPSKGHVQHFVDPDEPEETRRFKVPVMEDWLYDVDMLRGIVCIR